jgi:tetratricopeptide (TPR) repeat protein
VFKGQLNTENGTPKAIMRLRFFDFVLIGAVLIFAFLASSFAVRNSDFWLHLASGRLFAEGKHTFGVDPFSFTTDNRYWANHAWLFDWPLYRLYDLLGERLGEQRGGAVLVAIKALLISLLALVLLQMRRPGSRLGWPAACTLLAVLAMSPRLLLHSTCLSYVLLGLTLWLLWRPLDRSASSGRQLRHYAPLLLLFVLWVNVDAWFLLGPLLALLFWLGERIASDRSRGDEGPHTPAWLWLAGLAVCLLNPHHFHAFALPVELMPMPEALRHDVRFETMHASPWHRNLYFLPIAGVNLSGGAYLLLLALGALSFLLNVRNLAGWRLLVWLTFAGLSAWLVRIIPFFAVVAGPITALNWQDAFAGSRAETGNEGSAPSRWRRLVGGGCNLLLLMSSLVLIALAWPGWLQGFRDSGRHVDWAVQPDGSLRRLAERLHLWHQRDKLGMGRGFLSYPNVVHYCAWFCPEEKGFLDQRLQLFHDAADSYEAVCQALNPALVPEGRKASRGWRQILNDWGITHVVLYDTSLQRLAPALNQVAQENGDWTLLEIDGQASIVGWRDGDRRLPPGVPVFDAERLAFTESSETQREQAVPPAPGQGPGRDPRGDDFWSHFGKPIAPSPWQAESAWTLLQYFEARAPYEAQKRLHRGLSWTAFLAGLPALPTGSLEGLLRLAVHVELAPVDPQDFAEQPQFQQQPPALPLLAVRAARRALADNPDDANAYLHLGRAYLILFSQTTERDAIGSLPPLAELRHIQIAAALENALRRDPDSLIAHYNLAALYERQRFFDAALDHRRAALALERRALGRSGDAAAVRRLQQIEQSVKEMERHEFDAKHQFALQTRTLGSDPFRRAETALNLGLARLALEDVLLPAPTVLLGSEGVRMQVRLQLMLGRIEPARALLGSQDWKDNKANLGLMSLKTPGNTAAPVYQLPAYEWLLLCQSAADGDYDAAQATVQSQLRLVLPQEELAARAKQYRIELRGALVAEMLMGQSQLGMMQEIVNAARLDLTTNLQIIIQAAKTQELWMLLAALLELERGEAGAARESFRQAQWFGRFVPDEPPAIAAHSLAEAYLRFLAEAEPRP